MNRSTIVAGLRLLGLEPVEQEIATRSLAETLAWAVEAEELAAPETVRPPARGAA